MSRAPALFVSHGAPTFAIEPGVLGPKLAKLGAQLPPLAAIAVISAHWQTLGVEVMRSAAPKTVHDFGGFPPALYRLTYPAPGAPAQAEAAAAILKAAGIDARFDEDRGLDHGAWVPLMHLLPEPKVPVFQISLPFTFDTKDALQMGRALAALRRQGVMVMGSGSLTHNLSEIRRPDPNGPRYAAEFASWVRTQVERRDVDALVDYRQRAPHAARAHPTDEHFLPLLVAVGASEAEDSVSVLDGGITYGVLSMESYVFGPAGPRLSS